MSIPVSDNHLPNLNKHRKGVLACFVSLLGVLSTLASAQQPAVERLAVLERSLAPTISQVGRTAPRPDYQANDAYGATSAYKVDYGIQQKAGTDGDSDGDSIPDLVDVDDDNDTIPDDVEGTADADLDGVADCLDVDSDNDGISDLFETVVDSGLILLVDADRDGRLDATVAVGNNGLANVVELSAESSTSLTGTADLDGDGIPNHKDLDSDSDGIPDVLEAGNSDEFFDGRVDSFEDLDNDGLADRLLAMPVVPIDSDQDGIEDFRDLDSDEDGLTDRLETFGIDTDGDGHVDNPVDANNDGLDDGYQSRATPLPDTDNDEFPDFRDIDSDGDGITDTEEAFGSSNPNPSVNPSTPVNPQPGAQGVEGAQNEDAVLRTGESGSVFGCALSDDEKIPQTFDPMLLLMLIASVVIVLRRRLVFITKGRHLALSAIASIVLLANGCAAVPPVDRSADNTRQPYAGIGLGASFLNADTSDFAFDQDKNSSMASQVTLGLSLGNDRLGNDIGVEARAADLGEATFTNGGAVGYQVADISAAYKRHFGKYSGLARLGVGALFNDGDIRTTQQNKTHLLVGFGAEYNLNSQIGLRAEWQGHDVDVMHTQLSIMYRFGAKSNRASPLVIARNGSENTDAQKLTDAEFAAVPDKSNNPAEVAIGELAIERALPEPNRTEREADQQDTATIPEATTTGTEPTNPVKTIPDVEVAATADTVVPQESPSAEATAETPSVATSDEQLAVATAQDNPIDSEAQQSADGSQSVQSESLTTPAVDVNPADVNEDGANDALDNCVSTNAGLSALGKGCPMFEDLVPGLTFVPDTDQLTNSGEDVLDTVAQGLAAEAGIQVTVAVHAAPATDANEAMFLTRLRTIAIIRYLSDKGIDATRLRPEAYGDTQPLEDSKNPTDNDRVVLSTR